MTCWSRQFVMTYSGRQFVTYRGSSIKGQLISKAGKDEFVSFAFLLFTANKSNSSVHFLGESMARQSAFQFYLTFSMGSISTDFYSLDSIKNTVLGPNRQY